MLDWTKIDTIMLDMDGTLLDLHFDNYFWLTHLPMRYAQEHGTTESEAKHFIETHVEKYRGTLNWYCLDHWSELVKLDIPKLKHEVRHKIQTRPYAEKFLKQLKRINKKLILITNAHPDGLQLKLDVTEIDHWLDIVISSHEFQSPKEDQTFWHALKNREHFELDTTLFIDDTPRVLDSAKRFGIKHLICVTQPDSRKAPKEVPHYFCIQDFDEIMPQVQ